jgi:adenine phosphoribosyltransferase|tara:strand:- start:1591 stop:2094 length:504 start_codon:yes stop_codon:yes gene_type:complete
MIDYKNHITNVSNFPIKGITYRDIQPILAEISIFKSAIKDMGLLLDSIPDYWIAVESRGFIFASALAMEYGGGVRLIRKKGKLPNNRLMSVTYGLEYGNDELEMAYLPQYDYGSCVIVDDVLATGGTIGAAESLCNSHGLDIIDKLVLVDIGISKLTDVKSLIKYEE